jgi:hypothetical protein
VGEVGVVLKPVLRHWLLGLALHQVAVVVH